MHSAAQSSYILHERVVFKQDWALVRDDQQRADRFVIICKLLVVKRAIRVRQRLGEVLALESIQIAHFEVQLPKLLLKI